MNTITLEINNKEDLELIKMLTKRFGLKTISSPKRRKPLKKSNGKAMAEALEKIAESGSLSSIKNPVEWQRLQRVDRKLPNR